MDQDLQRMTELCRRLASLSLDPYSLHERALLQIAAIEKKLTDAAENGNTDEVFSGLLSAAEEKLLREKDLAERKKIAIEERFTSSCRALDDGASSLLSLPSLQKAVAHWFYKPNSEELCLLEGALLSLISEYERIRSALLELHREIVPMSSRSEARDEVFFLWLAAVLAEDFLPSTYSSSLESLLAARSEIEALECTVSGYRDAGLKIATTLLPPLFETLHSLLGTDRNAWENDDVGTAFRAVKSFREQMRQIADPLFKA